MMALSAQVSLYPLAQEDISPAIQAVIQTLEEHGLPHTVGPMSTVLWGEEEVVWKALQEAFRRAATYGLAVMVVTLSNACPLPSSGALIEEEA